MSEFTIVAVGDSTTAGTPGFKSPIEAPPDGAGVVESQYAYWLMRAYPDWHVLNRGVNGERSDQIRVRLARDILHFEPDVLVIIAGVNDIYQGRRADAVERELEAMYDMARTTSRVIPVVAGSILPYGTASVDENARMHEVNDWIRASVARHPHVAFCDTRAAVAQPPSVSRRLQADGARAWTGHQESSQQPAKPVGPDSPFDNRTMRGTRFAVSLELCRTSGGYLRRSSRGSA
jgi:lysophospholipase L1-like esterase